VVGLINSWGGGDVAVTIARLHQQLIDRQDQLGEVVAYTQALEKEALFMGDVLSHPDKTGYWLQYQEFNLAQLPQVQAFRSANPTATFDQYYDWLLQSSQPQGQPQPQAQPQFQPQPQATFNQMNMGVGQGGQSQGGQGGRTRAVDILHQMDSGHFGQFVSGLN